MSFRSGFVAVVGRPNVGKSSLVNRLIGAKAAIISSRPQTTRKRIRAILTTACFQAVFVDTPGVHRARNKLDEYMLDEIYYGIRDVDMVVFLVEAPAGYGSGDQFIFEKVQEADRPAILAVNKIDRIKPDKLQRILDDFQRQTGLPPLAVSAETGQGLDNLKEKIYQQLPEGPQFYPEDMYTDQLERDLIEELVREQIFQLLYEEIPYGTAVQLEEMKEREEQDLYYLRTNIFVEHSSHKAIIIGKNGSMLKKIGSRARKEIERMLGRKVYLDLWVKVRKNWRKDEKWLKRLGYKGQQ